MVFETRSPEPRIESRFFGRYLYPSERRKKDKTSSPNSWINFQRILENENSISGKILEEFSRKIFFFSRIFDQKKIQNNFLKKKHRKIFEEISETKIRDNLYMKPGKTLAEIDWGIRRRAPEEIFWEIYGWLPGNVVVKLFLRIPAKNVATFVLLSPTRTCHPEWCRPSNGD